MLLFVVFTLACLLFSLLSHFEIWKQQICYTSSLLFVTFLFVFMLTASVCSLERVDVPHPLQPYSTNLVVFIVRACLSLCLANDNPSHLLAVTRLQQTTPSSIDKTTRAMLTIIIVTWCCVHWCCNLVYGTTWMRSRWFMLTRMLGSLQSSFSCLFVCFAHPSSLILSLSKMKKRDWHNQITHYFHSVIWLLSLKEDLWTTKCAHMHTIAIIMGREQQESQGFLWNWGSRLAQPR